MAEEATGIEFMPKGEVSDQVLEEAIAAVVVADSIGRRKDGGQICFISASLETVLGSGAANGAGDAAGAKGRQVGRGF